MRGEFPALHLVIPSEKWGVRFNDMVKDYLDHDPEFGARYAGDMGHLEGYLAASRLMERDDPANPDRVPQSFFWLIDGAQDIVGIARLRHRLTPKLQQCGGHIGYEVPPSFRNRGYATRLLELMLPQAMNIGLTQVLLTCDHDNNASARVMIKCGAREIDPGYPETDKVQRRFIIELGNPT